MQTLCQTENNKIELALAEYAVEGNILLSLRIVSDEDWKNAAEINRHLQEKHRKILFHLKKLISTKIPNSCKIICLQSTRALTALFC